MAYNNGAPGQGSYQQSEESEIEVFNIRMLHLHSHSGNQSGSISKEVANQTTLSPQTQHSGGAIS
jgi:hypothetical protein